MCHPFLAFKKFLNKMLTFFCLRTEKLTCVNAIFPAILYNCGERKEDAMHIQDCLEEKDLFCRRYPEMELYLQNSMDMW